LHIAIQSRHSNIVRYLLSKDKSSLTIIDNEGHNPEYYASMQGREDIKEEFFTNRLSLLFYRILTDTSESSLDILVKYGQSLGCYDYTDFNMTNMGQGDTLLSSALIHGNIELAKTLENIGFSLESKDNYGITPDFWRSYFYGIESRRLETQEKINRVKSIASSNIQNRMLISE